MVNSASSDIFVRRYAPVDIQSWNNFVKLSPNATFLHDRHYMDYHSDQFNDHSLIIEQNNKIVALLPANQVGSVIYSHQGLTYAGFLVSPKLSATQMSMIVPLVGQYLRNQSITLLEYKPSPHIFHKRPSEADIYALFNVGARLVRVDLGTTVNIQSRIPFSGGRKDGIRKARKAGLVVRESQDISAFWDILSEVLESRHHTAPTHSIDQISLLKDRFPNQIRLYSTFQNEIMLAGLVLFDMGKTVHAQYMASNQSGRNLGALDFLLHKLLREILDNQDWFSFGTSTTNQGRILNEGLVRQKEMFGGSSIAFNHYHWHLGQNS